MNTKQANIMQKHLIRKKCCILQGEHTLVKSVAEFQCMCSEQLVREHSTGPGRGKIKLGLLGVECFQAQWFFWRVNSTQKFRNIFHLSMMYRTESKISPETHSQTHQERYQKFDWMFPEKVVRLRRNKTIQRKQAS